ncbi:MAG: DUF2868 domain-containing protein [Lautropia sp.]|nr:DUF2868 domain-containing protein [Lautropia sp.]
MTENEARQTLLVRAVERQPANDLWTDDDRQKATSDTHRRLGSGAAPGDFILTRAQHVVERLRNRKPEIVDAAEALRWRGWFSPLLIVVALIAGLALDAGAGQRINILSPPLVLILAWNIFSYLVLIVGHFLPANEQGGWIRQQLIRLATGQGWRSRKQVDSILPKFRASWFQTASPLYAQRALSLLHTGAMMFALGALAGLYLRGLAFEYRAGWESTFLGAEQVHALIQWLWGPASLISGIALPDVAHLATLRFPASAGENAANWIHLQTLTVLLIVVLPRLALALWHHLRARRLAADFPLPLDDAYFLDLQRTQRGETGIVWVQPYSYSPSETSRDGLVRLLRHEFSNLADMRVLPSLALGDEDDLKAPLPGIAGAAIAVALFNLSATPEAENHAVFLKTLSGLLPQNLPFVAIVDESAFRARFGHDTARLDTRRAAWQRILDKHTGISPVFADLANTDPASQPEVLRALETMLAAARRQPA